MDLGNGTERLGLATWTGSAWVNPGEYDSQTRDVNDAAPGDFVAGVGWVGTSGTAVAVYQDNVAATLDWASWTSAGGWVLQADVTTDLTGKGFTESVQIERFDNQNKLMALVSDSNSDLYAATYDGTTWTVTNSGSALETTLSSLDSAPFSFAIREDPPDDHMVVTATDGLATIGGTEVLTIQLVDQFGNPVSKALPVSVTVDLSATFFANDIGGTNGSGTLNGTLSASGSGSVTITDGAVEIVTVLANATGDAEVVANVSATVDFSAPAPPDLRQLHYRWRDDDAGDSVLNSGTGADGAIVITTPRNINTDPTLRGTVTTVASFGIGGTTLDVAAGEGVGFVAGDEVFLINMQGDATNSGNTGNYEFLTIHLTSTDTLTFTTPIQKLYGETTSNLVLGNQKVVLQRVPQWTTVTINSVGDLTANAWDGSSGGIVVFRATGAVTVNGTGKINADGLGYHLMAWAEKQQAQTGAARVLAWPRCLLQVLAAAVVAAGIPMRVQAVTVQEAAQVVATAAAAAGAAEGGMALSRELEGLVGLRMFPAAAVGLVVTVPLPVMAAMQAKMPLRLVASILPRPQKAAELRLEKEGLRSVLPVVESAQAGAAAAVVMVLTL
jgi:hypothetical protein